MVSGNDNGCGSTNTTPAVSLLGSARFGELLTDGEKKRDMREEEGKKDKGK